MKNKEIEQEIERRYDVWRRYSAHICREAGIPGESEDLLHDVLMKVIEQRPEFIIGLISQKKQDATGLDLFVFSMLKINALLPKSAYQRRLRRVPIDRGAEVEKLSEEDSQPPLLSDYFFLDEAIGILRAAARDENDKKVIEAMISGEPLNALDTGRSVAFAYKRQKKIASRCRKVGKTALDRRYEQERNDESERPHGARHRDS